MSKNGTEPKSLKQRKTNLPKKAAREAVRPKQTSCPSGITTGIDAGDRKSDKDDPVDAEKLARIGRLDPRLLAPIRHRGEQAQMHLMKIRVRAALVESRTDLVNSARGLAKSVGERLPDCDTEALGMAKMAGFPAALQETLTPLLRSIENLTAGIKQADAELEQIARTTYPETALLTQVPGVGTLTALTFILTVDDAGRSGKSRDVGCYLGLRPKRSKSGEQDPQLGITKEGDVYLRKLLVQAAHYTLGPFGPDSDLRRWGQKLSATGGKRAKKRAVVAVARKLAVLLHKLWVTGEAYEPLYNAKVQEQRERQHRSKQQKRRQAA